MIVARALLVPRLKPWPIDVLIPQIQAQQTSFEY
jgi:hypothetical protein